MSRAPNPIHCAARCRCADPRRHFLQAPQQRRWSAAAAEQVQLAALQALLACSQERGVLRPRLQLIGAAPHLQVGWLWRGTMARLCHMLVGPPLVYVALEVAASRQSSTGGR